MRSDVGLEALGITVLRREGRLRSLKCAHTMHLREAAIAIQGLAKFPSFPNIRQPFTLTIGIEDTIADVILQLATIAENKRAAAVQTQMSARRHPRRPDGSQLFLPDNMPGQTIEIARLDIEDLDVLRDSFAQDETF